MKRMGDMKTYSFDELKDEIIGPKGTPQRNRYEQKLEEELQSYHLGEAIKNTRLSQNLTPRTIGRENRRAKGADIEIGKG